MLATANYPYPLPGPPTHGQTTFEGRELLATDLFHRRELPVHFRLLLLSQVCKPCFWDGRKDKLVSRLVEKNKRIGLLQYTAAFK